MVRVAVMAAGGSACVWPVLQSLSALSHGRGTRSIRRRLARMAFVQPMPTATAHWISSPAGSKAASRACTSPIAAVPATRRGRSITVGKSPDGEDAVFFDADGDGDLDIISSAEGNSRRIQVHWAPPVGNYTRESEWRTETLYADGSQWMFAVPMDVDRRRGPDLIVGGKNERASIGWLESPADPRRAGDWKYHRLSDAGWIMSLIVKDMNRRRASRRAVERPFWRDGRRPLARKSRPDIGGSERTVDESLDRPARARADVDRRRRPRRRWRGRNRRPALFKG